MADRYKAPRGTHDVVPPNVTRWQFLEKQFAGLAALYGYDEIRTPAFEVTDLFVRSSGETSEVVTKQMYTFMDKGDRSMTLKPEGTAPVIRAYLEHNLGQQGQVTRLWYATQIFRYERPQKGRYRAAHQVGLELIGTPAPAADAEIIEMTVKFYERLGIKDVSVLMNCIGRKDARADFGEAILKHVDGWMKDQETDVQDRARKNPLRLLDSKDSAIKEAILGAPAITDYLSEDSKRHFNSVQSILQDAGVAFTVDPEIVRGLDYYTDTVFEVQSAGLGSQNALCGGGRYDDLIKDVGGPDTPSVGVAMGVERALIVMEDQGVEVTSDKIDAFLVSATDSAKSELTVLARELRTSGVAVQMDIDGKPIKNQMKQAARSGARYAVIIGDEEISANTVTAKRLEDGEQSTVPRGDLSAVLIESR